MENLVLQKYGIETYHIKEFDNLYEYLQIVNYLVLKYKEVRVFNTICDATFENQAAARELSNGVDIMIVIGGKNSSNTKQLFLHFLLTLLIFSQLFHSLSNFL